VKVFNNEGEFLYEIGSEGSSRLRCPVGLAVDKFNNLIVSDSANGNVLVFTLQGKFLHWIKGKPTELKQPWAVAVSLNAGQLFITDMEKHYVHVFECFRLLRSVVRNSRACLSCVPGSEDWAATPHVYD